MNPEYAWGNCLDQDQMVQNTASEKVLRYLLLIQQCFDKMNLFKYCDKYGKKLP